VLVAAHSVLKVRTGKKEIELALRQLLAQEASYVRR